MKKSKLVIILIIYSIGLFAAYFIGMKFPIKYAANKIAKMPSSQKYISLEPIMNSLNENKGNLNLYKKFELINSAYSPLYTLKKEYPNFAKTINGEIISISVFIKGTYKIDNNFIDVLIIQDKTFENGGFIINNNNKQNCTVYKYKDSFLIFNYSYDIYNNENNKKNINFIKNFFNEYSKLYKKASVSH